MGISNIITLFGGVALFLFGMSLMGEGLKKVAGSKLELLLYKLSNTPLKGLLLGAGVTAIIQSSSATSVMVVGFVNSGMMKVRQAMTVIMGAIIGTSITGWIICLSYMEGSSGLVSLLSTSSISAIVAVIGIVLRMFSKKQAKRHVGDILLGFAVLMFGMQAMSGAVAPLRNSPAFIRFMTAFSNPLLGILVGAAFTAVLQSASAAVGILQALSVTGAIRFVEAFPLLLGIGIGAAVPVLLSALGARTNGRRTSWAYLVVQTLGAVFCAAVWYIADGIADFSIKQMVMSPVSIAAVNTIFRVVCAIVLMPFIGAIEKLLNALVKESDQEREANADFDRLDERFLRQKFNLNKIDSIDAKLAQQITTSMRVDLFYQTAECRLVPEKLPIDELSTEYLHTLSDFERISDHAMNIRQVAQEKHDKKISFSDNGEHEMDVLLSAVNEILALAITAFISEDYEKAYQVEPLEEHIDVLCDELKLRHVERLQKGECSLQIGFVFNDLLTNFERVADHCSNIAVAMIELKQDEFQAHDYINNLKELRSHNFDALYNQYAEKYKI